MKYKEIPEGWESKVGTESRQSWFNLLENFNKYFNVCRQTGTVWGLGLEVGNKGYSNEDINPIFSNAISLNLGDPGYDGKTIPYPDNHFDYVYSSHVLEHIPDYKNAIKEWYRVTKVGGHIITVVPHQYLYEKKALLPSNWNGDHQRFYTGSSLLKEFEYTLIPNSYRVKVMEDNDIGFDYSIPPEVHSCGEYAITLIIKKIITPDWELK